MHYLPYTKEIGNVKVRLWEEPDDWAIEDAFDPSCHDIDELKDKVRRGILSWSVFFVTVEVNGIELGRNVVGGIMLDPSKHDPVDCARSNGMFREAVDEARQKLEELGDFGRDKDRENIFSKIERELANIPNENIDVLTDYVNNNWRWEKAAPAIRLFFNLIQLKKLQKN